VALPGFFLVISIRSSIVGVPGQRDFMTGEVVELSELKNVTDDVGVGVSDAQLEQVWQQLTRSKEAAVVGFLAVRSGPKLRFHYANYLVLSTIEIDSNFQGVGS